MTVLLLNASYAPLRVLTLKRAVCLVLDDKAEVIEESDAPIRSGSFEMGTPSVIRLKYFVKIPYKARIPLNHRTLMARDKGVCQFNDCARTGNTIDHLIPRSKGGAHTWDNVVAACRQCNSRKDDKLLGKRHGELDWTIKHKPVAPTGTRWLVLGIAPKMEAKWAPYLAN